MVNPLIKLKQFTQPEPELPDASAGDPEVELRKQQHRVNSRRAHFWNRVSQLSFWAMTAILIGSGAVAGLLGLGGIGAAGAAAASVAESASAAVSYAGLYVSLGLGASMGALSLVASNIENRIRVDNSLNFEEIHAKNIGKHTGEEVVKAMVTIVEQAKAKRHAHSPAASTIVVAEPETSTMPRPSLSPIPVGIARDASIPATRIETADATTQGTSKIILPAGITLH